MDINSEKATYIFDWAYPSPEDENAASKFISVITKDVKDIRCPHNLFDVMKGASEEKTSSAIDNPNALKREMTVIECMKDDNFIPRQVSLESFIHARTTKDGHATGPQALFGMSGVYFLFLLLQSIRA